MRSRMLLKSDAISTSLWALPSLTAKELKRQWRSLYGCAPPLRISRELLIRAVAYRIQEQTQGGLKEPTRKLLLRLAHDARDGKPLKISASAPTSAGTVLMREWQGVTHEVRVLDRGVLYQRRRYRSLSQVARLITGSRWSGPLFFGLRSRLQEENRRAR
jgi:Protein of unknown function (DUF2924)